VSEGGGNEKSCCKSQEERNFKIQKGMRKKSNLHKKAMMSSKNNKKIISGWRKFLKNLKEIIKMRKR
jgi:hypothetical protein